MDRLRDIGVRGLRRRGLAVALAVALGAGVGGCDVAEMETRYPGLTRELGEGSDALQRLEDLMSPENLRVQNDFSSDRTTRLLLTGELEKVTAADLDRVLAESRENERSFRELLADLDKVRGELREARVTVADYDDTEDGTQQFLREWNDYVGAMTRYAGGLGRTFSGFSHQFRDYEKLVQAAREAARRRSAVEFDAVRRDILRGADADLDRLGDVNRKPPSPDPMLKLAVEEAEANSIVVDVNEEYPDGYLAQVLE